MNLDEMNLQQVEERLAALDVEVREATEAEAVEKAAEEKKGLLTRKAELVDLEQRKKTALELNEGKAAPDKIVEIRKEEPKMEIEKMLDRSSEEYRLAWLKNLQGKEISEVERRALVGGTSALPDQTANKVIDILLDTVPLLNEIELFRVPGSINIAVEVTAPGATRQAAGGTVTESTAELRQVTLNGYNMNAFIRLGADLAQQAVPAFEDWLTRKLADAIANKIEDFIVNGDGSGDPKGIEYYATWDVGDGTGVDWTGGSSNDALAVADLDAAIGLLPAKYDRDSKFVMSKKTFYTNVANLTDLNNLPVVEREGRNFYVRGYPVVFSNYVTTGTIFFGDFKRGMVGNLSSNIQVEKQRNLAYNAWDFLGWAVFDCAPAAAGCIVKIAADIPA